MLPIMNTPLADKAPEPEAIWAVLRTEGIVLPITDRPIVGPLICLVKKPVKIVGDSFVWILEHSIGIDRWKLLPQERRMTCLLLIYNTDANKIAPQTSLYGTNLRIKGSQNQSWSESPDNYSVFLSTVI